VAYKAHDLLGDIGPDNVPIWRYMDLVHLMDTSRRRIQMSRRSLCRSKADGGPEIFEILFESEFDLGKPNNEAETRSE
jgi:hypothetical protein